MIVLDEDLFDILPIQQVEIVSEEPLEGPEEGIDNGLADMLYNLINDEYEAIQGYQQFTPNLDTHPEWKDVINDIISEEYTHIGQLNALLEEIAPNSTKTEEGELEAEEQIKSEENVINGNFTIL